MMKYRRKPVEVEVFRYDNSLAYVPQWIFDAFKNGSLAFMSERGSSESELYVIASNGNELVSVGDYVIHEEGKELCVCAADVFEELYEKI